MKIYFQRYKKNQQRWASYYSKLIMLLLLAVYSLLPIAKAQQYPVKLIPVVIPPYSLKIGDYATSTDNKLQLQVLMTDLLEPQHQTGIKFSLEAGLNAVPLARSNDFIVGMNPFMLYPGNNVTLTNVDIRSLFELQNLSGINAVQYSKPLSDGVYQFCFQAYDYFTKNNLSAKTCATVFMVQYDPPMLTLPQNAEKVQALSPYSGGAGIVFQWMPRQIAPNTKYIFTLKELWDQGQSPISGFLSAPPLWTEETYAPTLYYGIDKTQLIPGKRYAWQVQSKSGNPVLGANPTDDNGVYKNNGLSEIFYFDYVENCAVPTLLMAKNVGRGRVELQWSIAGQPAGLYNVQYRKKGSTAEWVSQQSYQASAILTGLEDQTEYEYRIGSVCGNTQTFNTTNPFENGNSGGNAYSYSGIQYFTTDANDVDNNYQCGIMSAIDIANKTPLNTQLGNNEVFMAGDFPVTVLSAQGSGVYTGVGYIEVPYLADTKIKVSFTNIKLNTDKKLIEGIIETTYDPNETAVHYASGGLGETFGDAGVKDVTVDYVITNVTYTATPPPGKITVYGDFGTGGTSSQQDFPGGKDYQIKDKDGNIWTVDENGNVTKVGKEAEGGASTSSNTDGVTGSGNTAAVDQYTAKGIKIEWKEDANGKFAYDTADKTKLPKSKYPSVKDTENNTVYVPYKATVNKQTELFDAKVSITDPTLKDSKIIFKTLSLGKAIEAIELSKTDTERNYQLKLPGTFDYAEEEVIAVLMPKESTGKQKVISNFRLVHLSPKTVNVSLVPLDANSQSKLQAQGNKINQVYNKIGVSFTVKEEPVLDISGIVNGNTINSEDADLMSTYSSQQQQINALYKGTDARYVLFVTNKTSSTGQNGYMRLNGQFGYVYNNAPQKTGAHELGHGVFKLEHPWKAYQTTKGATDLLMDYSTGEELSHLDWKQVNDPAFKLYAFQSQSSGEFNNYVVTPDLRIVNIKQSNTLTFDKNNKNIPTGTCPGFVTYNYNNTTKQFEDIKYYLWDNGKKGYINNSDNSDIIVPSTVTPNTESLVTLFYNYGECPGGVLDLKYGTISEKYKTAQGLLSIISEHQTEAAALKCIAFNSTTEDTKGKGWTQAELGVSLNCSSDNIKELLKSEIASINTINASTTAEQTNLILKQNYKDCVFANISIDQRIIILNNLLKDNVDDSQWEFSNGILSLGDTFFLDDLILSTPQNDRKKLLQDGFMKNNYKWLEILFNKSKGMMLKNNDATMTEIVPLFKGIASWVSTYYQQLNVPVTMETMIDIGPTGFNSYDYPKASVNPILLGTSEDKTSYDLYDGYATSHLGLGFIKLENGKINFSQDYLKKIKGTYIGLPGSDTRQDHSESFAMQVNPFEPVIMKSARSYPFLDIPNGEAAVPAFLAASYQQLILDKGADQSIRSLGNGIAITAAIIAIPETGGGSYVTYLTLVGGAVAGADEKIQSEWNALSYDQAQNSQYKAYYNAWETFYGAYALVEGGTGIYSLANNLRKINFIKSTKNFYGQMKNFGKDGELMNVWKGLKGLETGSITYKGIKYEDFIKTFTATEEQYKKAYQLWGEEKWTELYQYFKNNNINYDASINNVWPPFFGFKNFGQKEIGTNLNGKIFDRFQKNEGLGGGYASPVPSNSTFSLQSRALGVNYDDLQALGQSYYYIKFKIKNASPDLEFQYGQAAPWFEELGGATQIKSSKGFHQIPDELEVLEKWKFENGQWKELKLIDNIWK
ncbi:hypothetical protein HNP24_000170 [Chryseobacterium sediminis]|uniref:Fibronectin type-III domain-containing protein n=1 Tax=Chryseobacterium sediminis TaxID=1679494 RepID=A0ABR6PU42_9FLAO|nr:fibronectin type III domain-containing protein [Chryseobacterium sediminis]MBB6329220.1 hypothetical protein [Chryseobacterium sediminis]